MEENKKKKILKITLCTLGLILVLAIGSLAVYNASIPGTALNKLLVSQPDFKFNFTESNTVTMNNPSNNDKKDFSFNVIASSTDTNYMFDIDYSIFLKVNESSTISNDLVYVELFDKSNNTLVNKTKLSDLTKVEGKNNEYILKNNNILLYNESKTNDYILRYSYIDNTKVNYTKDDTSQSGTFKNTGTFNMTVNVSMNRFDYGKINSLSITTPPSKIEYNEGESFDKAGMVVKVNLNNNKSYEIKDYTISPSGALTTSNTEVTISYGGKSIKQSISVIVPKTSAQEFAQANVGTNGLEQITHEIDNTLQVGDDFVTEYRYRGGKVSNYVTFNNEAWRIIGIMPTEDTNGNVENRIKIIRDTSIGNKKWNETESNNWVTGTLNAYLNNDYYNTLSSNAKNMIGTTKYYLGGYKDSQIMPNIMWQYERKNDANRTGYYYGTNPIMQNDANKKIAIMYASDYGYAASKECTSNLFDYNNTNCKTTNNWLDKSKDIWLLPQYSDNSSSAFNVSSGGYVNGYGNVSISEYAVRPVLYLSSNVKISGGEGTSQKPYQLSIS